MAERVKGDCGANSMEHSFPLTHLIPIGLWVMVIGCHLGSARVHLRRVGERNLGGLVFFEILKRDRMAPAEFLDTRSDRSEIVGREVGPRFLLGWTRRRERRYRQGKTLANRTFLIPSPKQNEPDGGTSARLVLDKLVSFIDRA